MAEPFRVALFVTCLVDLFRPSVGFAAVKLLEDAGCVVEVPEAQSCCGQPGYNSGDRADAKAIARQVIAAFSGYDYVVVPSGSCGGMIKTHYPALFADDPAMAEQAEALAARTYELISFLADVLKRDQVDGALCRHGHLSRCLLGPARARRQGAAATLAAHGRRADAQGDGDARSLLRLRRHVLRQISRDLRQDGLATKPPISPRPAPIRCSAAIWAASSTWRASSRGSANPSPYAMSPKCWRT